MSFVSTSEIFAASYHKVLQKAREYKKQHNEISFSNAVEAQLPIEPEVQRILLVDWLTNRKSGQLSNALITILHNKFPKDFNILREKCLSAPESNCFNTLLKEGISMGRYIQYSSYLLKKETECSTKLSILTSIHDQGDFFIAKNKIHDNLGRYQKCKKTSGSMIAEVFIVALLVDYEMGEARSTICKKIKKELHAWSKLKIATEACLQN